MQHGTILDYVRWRGDLTFDQAPFNIVDNLVFSFLAYSDFYEVPVSKEENKEGIPLKEYYDRLMEIGGFPKSLSWIIKEKELEVIASSKRFGSVLIRNYVDIIKNDKSDTLQFGAMNFCFGNNEHYLAFRGTDNSIAGWKEDMDLTYKRVPAQKLSREYVEENIIDDGTYYIGGHSKGAHLAIYAASTMDKEKYEKVKTIFDNDGPGICKDVQDPSFLSSIDRKTIRIIPHYCVIGMFFPFDYSDTRIVQSIEKGLMQHDIKSWLVCGDCLCETDRIDPEAKLIDDALAMFISDTSVGDREKAINDIFSIFGDNGKKKTVTSVTDGGIKELNRVFLQLSNITPETRKAMTRLPFTVWFGRTLMNFRHIRWIDFIIHYPALPMSIGFLILGLLFLFTPDTVIPYIVGGVFSLVTIIEFLTFLYLLYLSHWNLKTNLSRLYIVIISIAISSSFFISGRLMNVVSEVVLGIVLMILSFIMISRVIEMHKKKNYFLMVLSIIESILMFVTGVYFVIMNSYDEFSLQQISAIIFFCISGLRMFDGSYEVYKMHKNGSMK